MSSYRASPPVVLLRGLARRCPRCGGGRLFESWFRMRERCPTCRLRFEREEGFFLGAFVVNFAAVLAALGAFIGVSIAITLPDPPLATLSIAGTAVAVGVPLVWYPFSKTIWAAIDLVMRPIEPEEIADAGAASKRP